MAILAEDLEIAAVRVGMLGSAAIGSTVASTLKAWTYPISWSIRCCDPRQVPLVG